jgi:hypothetical protein
MLKGVEGKLHEEEEIYPNRLPYSPKIDDYHFLPPKIQKIYEETHSAFNCKLYILTGVGIRILVEAVCKERSATGHNLKRQSDSLVSQGVSTTEGAEILHSTRLLGNRAAHEAEALDQSILRTALSIAEFLLLSVYIIPAKAGGLPRRYSP